MFCILNFVKTNATHIQVSFGEHTYTVTFLCWFCSYGYVLKHRGIQIQANCYESDVLP